MARLSPDSPLVRAIRAAIDVARADVLAAGRWPNPRVTFDRESVAGITEHMTMVGQLLPITGQRRLQVRAASALVDASAGRADDEMRRARADLRQSFAQLVAAKAREGALTTARERLRGVADILAKREFATARVQDAELRSSIKVPASIEPLSGGEAVVAAPSAGR